MNGFLAILRRELGQRGAILAAAALASLIPLATPIARHLSGTDAAEARGWMALIASTAFAVAVTIALGASAIVPRVATRRIGFDFSRPLSGAALWVGTISAAILLAVAPTAIIWIPARVVGAQPVWSDLFHERVAGPAWLLLAVAGLPVLFSVVHAVTLVFRSRSSLVALDAVLAIVAWLGISAAVDRLPWRFAALPRVATLSGFGVASAVAFIAAGLASLTRGRTDIRAAHRALSTVLWPIVLGVAAAANAYAAWVMAARPVDLSAAEGFWARPAPRGPWVELVGYARGADARFLYDTKSGRFVRSQTADWRGPTFSRDGRRAVWIEGTDRGGPFPVRSWQLGDPASKPVVTRLLLNGYAPLMELSPDGARLATWEQGILSIHDLDAQRTLASARIEADDRASLAGVFVGRDVFRLYRASGSTIDILQLDAATRGLTTRGRIEGLGALRAFELDASGERILTVEGNRTTRLFDGATGIPRATLAEAPADSRWPVFLPDGRIVMSEQVSRDRRLRIFGPDGKPEREVGLPRGFQPFLGGEIAAGQLCLSLSDGSPTVTTWLVDLETGTMRQVAEDLRPIQIRGSIPDVGSDATRLFSGPGRSSLVFFDPLTGERRVILGTPGS